MRAPRNTLCTVRSTVLLVVLLVSVFILLDSYNWQLLSLTWQSSFAPSHSEAENPARDPSFAQDMNALAHSAHPTRGPKLTPGLNVATASKSTDNSSSSLDIKDGDEYDDELQSSPRKYVAGQTPIKEDNVEDLDDHGSRSEAATSSGSDTPDHHGRGMPSTQNSSAPETLGTSSQSSHANGDQDKLVESNGSTVTSPRWNDASNDGVSYIDKEGRPTRTEGDEFTSLPEPAAAPSGVAGLPKAKKPRRYDELSNLEKVELDLWQARAAMRKVALAQMNATHAHGRSGHSADGEPWGEVYRNAAIFRQSYQEMERRFKVYAYQEGEEPLVHNGPCKEIYAVEGRFIQELQADNPFVTSDPEAAHVFFLPFSVAMMVTYLYTADSGDMSPLLRFVKDYVHVVSRKYPYWARSEGADHFMLSCHDWGPHVSRADENLVLKTIRVLCNANVSEGYIPTKDASLPEINLVGGDIPAALGGLPADKRMHLAFFAGADHGPVRPQLFRSWEGKDDNILVYHQVPAGGKSYHEYMKASRYCLCPGGYEVNSPRIVEAIYNDCVPVVIADNFVLPFSDVLDWKTFVVHVSEKDIPNLKSILEAIPMEKYIQMQSRLNQVRPHFLINQPPQRYDAFHMILHSVWLRRLNIRVLG